MGINRLPLALAVLAVVVLAASALGTRAHLWSYRGGFQGLRLATICGLIAAACALVSLAVPNLRSGAAGSLVAGIVLGLAVAYVPWQFMRQARAVPPIHDISTDLIDPPEFVAVLPLRAGASNPASHGGAEVAAAQRQGYPDIEPLHLSAPPAAAFAQALAAAHAMGWDLVAADPQSGRIEATATSAWFGFKDDVVVRVKMSASGSRVDVRSASRVGKSDVGANARRIRAYLGKVAASQ